MSDSIKLHCPYCKEGFDLPVAYIKELVTGMEQVKVLEVASQLHEKRGPYYDKWLAAMEAQRGEERCTDCLWLYCQQANPLYHVDSCYARGHREGQFACAHYILDPKTV